MTSKKKNIASQALLDMNNIVSAIKEESTKSLNLMLDEAVKNALREECCKEEDDDEYEIQDNDSDSENDNEKEEKKSENKKSKKKSSSVDEDDDIETSNAEEQQPVAGGQEAGYGQGFEGEGDGEEMEPGQEQNMEPAQAEVGDADGEDEWDKYSDYKVDDNTYDLTGENDIETAAKVYKLLTNDDEVIVRQDGNTIQLTDNDAGTEYVIDLGVDGEEDSEGGYGEEQQNIQEINRRIAGFDEDEDEYEEPDDSDIDDDLDDDLDDELYNDYPDEDPTRWEEPYSDEDDDEVDLGFDEDFEEEPWMMENKINKNKKRRQMKESKQVLFEVDLGYTDSYQDKDPIAGLSNDEPSKTGKSWHKGVPTGTKKPWAGPSKTQGDPFKKTVNEEDDMPTDAMDTEEPMEEGTNVGGAVQKRSNSKTHEPENRKEHGPGKNKRHVSHAGQYNELVSEAKKLKAENKQLKEAVVSLKTNLREAYVTNVNLGKIAKLFLENSTNQNEKISIVNRFCNEAKTVKDSEKLYESISKELKSKNPNIGINLTETSQTANGTKMLNENVEYRSEDLLKTIDLMTRINNL